LRGYTGVATRDGSDVSSIGDRAGALVMLQRNKEKLAEVKTVLCAAATRANRLLRGRRSARWGGESADSQT